MSLTKRKRKQKIKWENVYNVTIFLEIISMKGKDGSLQLKAKVTLTDQ